MVKKKPPPNSRVTSGPGSGAGMSGRPANLKPITPGAAKMSRSMPAGVPGPQKKSRAEVDALLSKGGYRRKSSTQQKKY